MLFPFWTPVKDAEGVTFTDYKKYLSKKEKRLDIKDKKEDVTRRGKKVTKLALSDLRRLKKDRVQVSVNDFEGAFSLSDIINYETGEVIIESNTELTAAKLQQIIEEGVESFEVFFPRNDIIGEII